MDDTFLSAGDDGTVRLWDLRSPTCKVSLYRALWEKELNEDLCDQGLLNEVGGSTIAAFDNTGLVFAVACSDTQTIMLYGTNTMDSVRSSRRVQVPYY